MREKDSIYRTVGAMEPLLPRSFREGCATLTTMIFSEAGELEGRLPSRILRKEIARLIRRMNSYYSNLIEGHKTLPSEIEAAEKKALISGDEEKQRSIRMGLAHLEVEELIRERIASQPSLNPFSADFIRFIHGQFYQRLPEEDRYTLSTTGKKYPIPPGEIRSYQVEVGEHLPPDYAELDHFLARFESYYSSGEILATEKLMAAAAAHHRLAWIHPFGDGNGRVIRLQSQAALSLAGVRGEGLWTLSRGLARQRALYYRLLQNADSVRLNDYDGRGNLSDRYLGEFCVFFLEQVLDQIRFMSGLIDPIGLGERLERHIRVERDDLGRYREDVAKILKHLCLHGQIPRGEIAGILGRSASGSRLITRRMIEKELVVSDGERSPIRIQFTGKTVEACFPRLFSLE